ALVRLPSRRDLSMKGKASPKLVIVSNRLPFRLHRRKSGDWRFEPGAGGLVTALAPILRNRGGTWVGWPGVTAEDAPSNLN
ncbi:MAG TPA: hypothetical protein P5568_14685, partial [Acidobacteriota bacterium]|nr:hypothetical protein [Acidobacteriota bacterium]